MGSVKFKLQNIIIENRRNLDEHWWMMYRGDRFGYDNIESANTLRARNFVEFFTYFNSFSLGKWQKYTNIGNVTLNLNVKGHFSIRLFGHYMEGGEIEKEMFEPKEYYFTEKINVIINGFTCY